MGSQKPPLASFTPQPHHKTMASQPGSRRFFRLFTPVLILASAAFLVIVPFFFLGIPSGHDLEFHMNSWMEVLACWRDGLIYPRWAALAHYGYGEARFLFYPPASWMLGAALGSFLPWKVVAGAYVWLTLIISGCSMFLLAREWMSRNEALFAAAFYIATPYSIVLIYWRSAFAELLAAALVPLLALIVLRIPEKGPRSIVPLALVISAAWLTNVPSAVMVNYSLALLVLTIAISYRSFQVLLHGAAAVVLGPLLASFYLLPAFYEQGWVNVGQALSEGYRPQDNFLFVTTADVSHTEFNHFISIVAAAEVIALFVAGLLALRRKMRPRAFSILAIWGGVLSISMFSVTGIFWNHLPELRFMQFPWRWLLCLNVPLAIFAARAWQQWWPRAALYVLLLASIFYVSNKAVPPWWDHAADIADIVSNHVSKAGYDGADEYLPIAADGSQIKPDAPDVVYEGSGTARIAINRWDPETKNFVVTANQPGKLVLHLFNYPAWKASVNGQSTALRTQESTGQMTIPTQSGTSNIETKFGRTRDRTAGAIISIFTAALMLLMAIAFKKPTDKDASPLTEQVTI
jgi:hypothetical protein